MRKMSLFIINLILLLNVGLVSAISQQEINEAKTLIDSKADCKSLSVPQLEIIGEYYMEQMHPGESHELMHKMMGLKEDSEEEEQFHINMARRLYCDDNIYVGYGMMGSGDMMGMMNMMGGQFPQTNMIGNWGYWNFINILYIILLIGFIILVYLWIIRLHNNNTKRKY